MRSNEADVPISLRLLRVPEDIGWTLRSSATHNAEINVLDWTAAVPPVDAGLPESIVQILSTSLCQVAQVTFLDATSANKLRPPGFGSWLGKPVFSVTTTSRPEIAAHLFSDSTFPWEQRGQVVVLTPHGVTPTLAYEDMFCLWSSATPDLHSLATRMDALGYLLPGPDGDFLEIVSFAPSFWRQLERSIWGHNTD